MELITSFHNISGEILRLLSVKATRDNRASQEEATTIEVFYESVKKLIEDVDKDRHLLYITGLNDRMKGKLMEAELNMVYADLVRNNYDMIELMKRSSCIKAVRESEPLKIAGKKPQMSESQTKQAKVKYLKNEVSLNEIYGAFEMPEKLVREFIREKDG